MKKCLPLFILPFLLSSCSSNYDWIKVGEKDTLTFTIGGERKYEVKFDDKNENKIEFILSNLNETVRNVGVIKSHSIESFYVNGVKVDACTTQSPVGATTLYPITFKDGVCNITVELLTSDFTYVAFQETTKGTDWSNESFDTISINLK